MVLYTDNNLISLVKSNEGLSLAVYNDIRGIPTIGYGHNLNYPIPLVAANIIFMDDLRAAWLDLANNYSYFLDLTENQQRVLIDMRFWLGSHGFRSFKKMHDALNERRFSVAAREVKDSLAARQVPWRAQKIADDLIP